MVLNGAVSMHGHAKGVIIILMKFKMYGIVKEAFMTISILLND